MSEAAAADKLGIPGEAVDYQTSGTKNNRFRSGGKALVAKFPCDGDLTQSIGDAVGSIGGFERLVEPGDEILVKPNFNTEDPPPASSDVEFVQAVIQLLYQYGAGRVVVGDSSTMLRSTQTILQNLGMSQATEEAGAELLSFDDGEWSKVDTGGAYLRRVALAEAGLGAAKIVYVPCIKTHNLADLSMSLKLAMGFVRPRDRIGMHVRRLKEKLVDLNLAIAPDLIIMGGRRCFISGGPSIGEVREPNLILASGDRIAIDVEALKAIRSYPGNDLESAPWELPMIRRAVELELGAASEGEYRVVDGDGRSPLSA
jgi:uncharacterized protein (DUF362 family)